MSAAATKSKPILRTERVLKAKLYLAEAARKGRGLTTPELLTILLAEEMAVTACKGGLTKEEALEHFSKALDMAADGLLPRSGLDLGANHPLIARPRG